VPFGEVFIEERNNTWNTPYLFNAKELDEKTGLYYYGARYYAPRISLWLSTDPLQEKYPNFSTYAYCSNNPINHIDPYGMDDYEINSKGTVVNRIETTERDAFFMVDKKGNRIEGKELTFEYGTVENFNSQYSDKAKITFDRYNVRGDDNGKQLFEFFANNTTVEWSQLLLGQKGDNGLNIISTSHEKTKKKVSVFYLIININLVIPLEDTIITTLTIPLILLE
jgi:RHS repeat-associated protein